MITQHQLPLLTLVKTRLKMPELNTEERPSILRKKKGPNQALFVLSSKLRSEWNVFLISLSSMIVYSLVFRRSVQFPCQFHDWQLIMGHNSIP
jgi:hypothetical protein